MRRLGSWAFRQPLEAAQQRLMMCSPNRLTRLRVTNYARSGAWLPMSASAYFLQAPLHHVMHAWRLILPAGRRCSGIRWCLSFIQVRRGLRPQSGLHRRPVVRGALRSTRALMILNS
jgi:hypothetical protein